MYMLTNEQLFDMVAPIFTYFQVDLQYKKEAQEGLAKLKKVQSQLPELGYPELYHALYRKRSVDGLNSLEIWRAYNQLIEEIVHEYDEDLEPIHDYWGARAFKDKEGNNVLAGDAHDQYACFLSYEALKEYLEE